MGKKPDLAAAVVQAESDAAMNADVLTRLHQRKGSPAAEQSPQSVPVKSPGSERQRTADQTSRQPVSDAEVTVSLSTRISKPLRQRLKRISLLREEQGQQPCSIQHIVTEALTEWLKRNHG